MVFLSMLSSTNVGRPAPRGYHTQLLARRSRLQRKIKDVKWLCKRTVAPRKCTFWRDGRPAMFRAEHRASW